MNIRQIQDIQNFCIIVLVSLIVSQDGFKKEKLYKNSDLVKVIT